MLNFNKKKYVSFDNLKSFNGLLQSSLKEKIDGYKSEINVKVDERFKVLSGQQQTDSEVIDAREGQVSLSENLKTYVKKEEHENLDNKISNQIEEVKTDILTMSNEVEMNTEYINANKSAIQRVIDFVDSFKCEFLIGTNGYLKLPDVMGGFLIQWGRTYVTFNNEQYKATTVKYPIPFKTDIYFQTCNMFNDCTEAYETNTSIVWDNLLQGKICIYNTKRNMSSDVFVYYISLGK